jgi:hypothetical protein
MPSRGVVINERRLAGPERRRAAGSWRGGPGMVMLPSLPVASAWFIMDLDNDVRRSP